VSIWYYVQFTYKALLLSPHRDSLVNIFKSNLDYQIMPSVLWKVELMFYFVFLPCMDPTLYKILMEWNLRQKTIFTK